MHEICVLTVNKMLEITGFQLNFSVNLINYSNKTPPLQTAVGWNSLTPFSSIIITNSTPSPNLSTTTWKQIAPFSTSVNSGRVKKKITDHPVLNLTLLAGDTCMKSHQYAGGSERALMSSLWWQQNRPDSPSGQGHPRSPGPARAMEDPLRLTLSPHCVTYVL